MNSTESIALALSFSASVKLLLLTLHAPRDSAATVPASSFLHAGGEVGGAAGGGLSNGISALIEAKAHGRRSTCLQAAGQLHCMMDGAVDVIGAPARHGAGMCRCCSDPSSTWPMQNRPSAGCWMHACLLQISLVKLPRRLAIAGSDRGVMLRRSFLYQLLY